MSHLSLTHRDLVAAPQGDLRPSHCERSRGSSASALGLPGVVSAGLQLADDDGQGREGAVVGMERDEPRVRVRGSGKLGQRQIIVYESEDRGLRRFQRFVACYVLGPCSCLSRDSWAARPAGMERALCTTMWYRSPLTRVQGLSRLRLDCSGAWGPKSTRWVRVLQQGMTPLLGRYPRSLGRAFGRPYWPLFAGTVHDPPISPEFKHLSLPELAVALGLVGVERPRPLEPYLGASGELTDGTLILSPKPRIAG